METEELMELIIRMFFKAIFNKIIHFFKAVFNKIIHITTEVKKKTFSTIDQRPLLADN